MGREKQLKDKIGKASYGVFNTVIDIGLFVFAFGVQGYSLSSGRRDVFEAISESVKFVKVVRRQYLKCAIYRGATKNYFRKKENGWEITELGRKRLEEILPQYHESRQWDGKIYLITYDIPEKRKKDRELLREYLRRAGCGMFQESVWLAPYNPKKSLTELISERNLSGFVVVSAIGKDGNVGQIPIRKLVGKVYKLDKLNERYKDYLKQVGEGRLSFWETKLLFFSILKDDPQLPFSLLPKNWMGGKAYEIYKKSLIKI